MSDSDQNSDEYRYADRPMLREPNKLSVTVNNREYLLTSEFLAYVESIADRRFEENEYVNYYWKVADSDDVKEEDRHSVGDPILCVETSGRVVPWDRLSEMEFEMQGPSVEDQGGQDTRDNGNGTVEVDPSDGPETFDPSDQDGEMEDFSIVMTPQGVRMYPDPEDGKFSTVPPEPEEYPEEEPELLIPVPNLGLDERWSTGRAITSQQISAKWNVQAKADDAPDGAETFTGEPRDNSHDQWEGILQMHDCEVIGEMAPENKPDPEENSGESDRKPWDYDDKDLDPDSNQVGARWHL